MAPLMTIGATMPVRRRPAINVTVSQRPMGASATSRSPQGLQPLRRTILVVIAVSSINTRRVVSSQPCSRIQRRRASHVGSLPLLRPQAFFEGDVMASEEARQRAAARRDTSLAQYRDELIQCKIRLLADKGENLLRMLLQRRRAPSTGHWLGRPIFMKALHPADRGASADLELFGRLTSRSPRLHELNH